MTIEEFYKEVKKLNINITEEMKEKLNIYTKFLQEYNTYTNLTRITNIQDIYLKHFYDSLTLTKVIDLNTCQTLLDFGTGAGFPGMVLKIFFPKLKVTLVDSNKKKTTFLELLKEKINVDNIEIINTRVEALNKTHLNYFDIVTSRAVTNMPVLAELSLPLVKKDKFFIAMKGSNEEEIEEGKYAISKLNGKIIHIEKFELSKDAGYRNIVLVKKLKETNSTSLRSYEKIIKNPLKNK